MGSAAQSIGKGCLLDSNAWAITHCPANQAGKGELGGQMRKPIIIGGKIASIPRLGQGRKEVIAEELRKGCGMSYKFNLLRLLRSETDLGKGCITEHLAYEFTNEGRKVQVAKVGAIGDDEGGGHGNFLNLITMIAGTSLLVLKNIVVNSHYVRKLGLKELGEKGIEIRNASSGSARHENGSIFEEQKNKLLKFLTFMRMHLLYFKIVDIRDFGKKGRDCMIGDSKLFEQIGEFSCC